MNAIERTRRLPIVSTICAIALLGACENAHSIPDHPTWRDVEPILRAQCLQCHGGSARVTASVGDVIYRFDFFDLTRDVCGDAAAAVDVPVLAAGRASLMAQAITSVGPALRPRMPPAPAPALAEWEWGTILRWTEDPRKGEMPPGNRPPTVRLKDTTFLADQQGTLSTVVEDPDGEASVGILTVGDLELNMDHPGAFTSVVDTSGWPAGDYPVQAVVCDGWNSATYRLGSLLVRHD